ncbi:unnamed protein product, partial [Laminaria digitata]
MNFTGKTLLFLFCSLFFSTKIKSQNTAVDSLKNELFVHTQKDSTRVNLLNELAYSYHNEDFDTAKVYIEESEDIADAIGFTKGKAKSIYVRGVLEAVESNYRKGFSRYKEAIELYKTIAWEDGIAECYKDMGVFMYNNGDQKQAIAYYTKALEILNEFGKKKEIAWILYEIGWSYIDIDNYSDARAHLLKALKINEEIGNE